ncbi:MAG: hypothetical protein PHG23_01205 [Candidatus Pacebacteria bacterium]|nr:hypothetical protein [Candidatus Paceibacterota bacterium]
MITEEIKETKDKLIPKRKNIRPIVVFIFILMLLFVGYHFLGNYFVGAIWIVNAILLGVLLLIIMILAGFAVLKSLFLVAAEFSLLMLLAQSYCGVSNRSISSDDALKILLAVGILYIVFTFFHSLYKEIKKFYKKDERGSWLKEKIGTGILFLFFAAILIWQIYLVVYPIIQNLCISK